MISWTIHIIKFPSRHIDDDQYFDAVINVAIQNITFPLWLILLISFTSYKFGTTMPSPSHLPAREKQ